MTSTVIALANRFLRTRPVTAFAVLVFALAYGVGLPAQVALSMFLPSLDATAVHYLGRVFVVGAPAIAALILTQAAGDGHTQRWIAQLRPSPIALRWLPITNVRICFGRGLGGVQERAEPHNGMFIGALSD